MGFFKKVGKKIHRIKKVGNKASHKIAVGLKRSGGALKKFGQATTAAGTIFGQPELIALGGSMYGVGHGLKRGGKGLEKTRRKHLE